MCALRRLFPTVLFLLVVCPVIAQDDEDHTPPARVLSMTATEWNADFARRHGGQETEASDRQSLALYGDCLRARNDARLRRLPARTRARLGHVRAACAALSDDALSLAEVYNGGGTMFIEIFSAAVVDDEEFAWSLIRQAPTRDPAGTVRPRRLLQTRLAGITASVRTADPALPVRRAQMKEAYGEPVPSEKTRRARGAYASLRADLAVLSDLIARSPSHEALAVSRYVAQSLPDRLHPFR